MSDGGMWVDLMGKSELINGGMRGYLDKVLWTEWRAEWTNEWKNRLTEEMGGMMDGRVGEQGLMKG